MFRKILGSFFLFFLFACVIKQPPLPSVSLNPNDVAQMRKEKSYWIEVQIPQHRLVLAKKDDIVKIYPIAVGMPSYPTPIGQRVINRIIWNPWWVPPKTSAWVEDPTPIAPRSADNPLGEIKMPLGNSYLIHGTKQIVSIGRWASHGCIRMVYEDLFGVVSLLLSEYSKESAVDMMEKANQIPHKEFFNKLDFDVPVFLTYDLVKIQNDYVAIYPDIYKKQKDLAHYVVEVVSENLDKGKKVSERKVRSLLKLHKNQTIHVPVETILE